MNAEIFQRIILDYQQKEKDEFTKRELDIEFIPNMAIGIVGTRRCGKTFRTHQIAQEMKIENVCRIQFNDHRIINIISEKLNLIDDAYYGLFPDKRNKETVLFIFDEIHRIDGWENYILYLIESKFHKVVITGSTAALQRGEYSSALRGKFFPYELTPFSFREFLRHYKIEEDSVSSGGRDFLRK